MLVCVVERRTLFEPHFAPSRKRSPLSGIYAAYLFRYEPPVALWRKISEGYVEWPQSPLNTGRCIQKHFLMDGDTPSLAPFNTSRPPLKSVFSGDLWTVCRPRENPPPPPSPFLFFLFFFLFFLPWKRVCPAKRAKDEKRSRLCGHSCLRRFERPHRGISATEREIEVI